MGQRGRLRSLSAPPFLNYEGKKNGLQTADQYSLFGCRDAELWCGKQAAGPVAARTPECRARWPAKTPPRSTQNDEDRRKDLCFGTRRRKTCNAVGGSERRAVSAHV